LPREVRQIGDGRHSVLERHFADLFAVGKRKRRAPDIRCIEAVGGNLRKNLFNIFVGWIENIPANA
jgi:hypothetical protein